MTREQIEAKIKKLDTQYWALLNQAKEVQKKGEEREELYFYQIDHAKSDRAKLRLSEIQDKMMNRTCQRRMALEMKADIISKQKKILMKIILEMGK